MLLPEAIVFQLFSDGFGRFEEGMWCRKRDSNPRPHHYEIFQALQSQSRDMAESMAETNPVTFRLFREIPYATELRKPSHLRSRFGMMAKLCDSALNWPIASACKHMRC